MSNGGLDCVGALRRGGVWGKDAGVEPVRSLMDWSARSQVMLGAALPCRNGMQATFIAEFSTSHIKNKIKFDNILNMLA